eukprot:g2474.t1
MPESVLYDAGHDRLVVSVMQGAPNAVDGNGHLALLSTDGKTIDPAWATGMDAPKGLALMGGQIFAADLTYLRIVDAASGSLVASLPAEGAVFLNDVATSGEAVFVSDMMTHTIWRYAEGRFEKWLETPVLAHPNGLFWDNGRLLVGSWGMGLQDDFTTEAPGSLLSIDPETKAISVVASDIGNIDGIVRLNGKLVLNDWINGKAFEISADGAATEILAEPAGLADISAANGTLYLPHMLEGRIEARFSEPAVNDLSLRVDAGEFYALLGPNGAGKTTTLRMVSGLLEADAGSVRICGIDAFADPIAAKKVLAWVPDEPMVYEKLTPLEYLEFVAGLWNMDADFAHHKADSLLEVFGLAPHANERCGGFSKGMRQKVALAGALIHEPRLIILDEPLTGLDAGSARQVKQVLTNLVAEGVTVIMTTHILEVAERMADRIGIIAQGQLVAEGTLAELRSRASAEGHSLEDIFLDIVGGAQSDALAEPTQVPDERTGLKRTLIGMGIFYAILHLIAYAVLAPQFAGGFQLDQTALAVISVSVLLSFTMMLSQAIESVTRAFYARDDLDLILSSPAPSRDLFLVRIAMMAVTSWVMSALVISPFLNMAAHLGGGHWLSGYLVILAASLTATGVGILLTLALFQTVGPKRTRLLAQILAAVVGAAFLIGMQVVAILSFGSMSRFALFEADFLSANLPSASSLWWFPARAVSGQADVLSLLLAGSLVVFATGAWCGAIQFRRIVVKALGVAETTRRSRAADRPFRNRSALGALFQKELKLIARDPWLVSQTLMQVLYLVPPAVMLWVSFGKDTEISVLVAPVIVMATGQLAGGLAWLTISGEDAPDLIATAPISAGMRLWAKVLAAQTLITAVLLPIILTLAVLSMSGALITFAGAMIASASAILIQLWFRAQASRTTFRRRQVASKASTLAEAGASISCAGATALVAAGNTLALLPVVLLLIVLGIAWSVRPKQGVTI